MRSKSTNYHLNNIHHYNSRQSHHSRSRSRLRSHSLSLLSSLHHHHHNHHYDHHQRSMERRTSSPNNYNHKRSGSRLIPPAFMKQAAIISTNHDYPDGKIDHIENQEALEKLSSRRSWDYFNLLDEGNCTNDISKAIDIDREIPFISDTNKARIQ